MNQKDKSVEENAAPSIVGVKRKYDSEAPRVGMVFESLDEVSAFYCLYAKATGFDSKIRDSKPFPRSNEIRSRTYTCSRQGIPQQNQNAAIDGKKMTRTIKCGCPVSFTVKRSTPNDLWVAATAKNTHNHELTSPRSICNLRNHKSMPSVAKCLVEKFNNTGLPTGKVSDIVSDENGNNFSSRDCWNYARDVRRKNLDLGDADSVLEYCIQKQNQDPNFYYSISHDFESRMVNFFWVDSRARLLYERFGDVVVFDTTYKTNKYDLPFGLFVGINHHFQSISFGCALLQDESETSYEWLFTTWLKAMHGKQPKSILTDQDKAIGNMVKKVFTTTTHRLCLWHILQKFPQKYPHIYKTKSAFKQDLHRCLYKMVSTDEFDREWREVMTRYNLKEDKWLNGLFEIRSSWIPVYNRTVFFAGMNTTQRCESMHAFFDSFLNKDTTLREFVDKYEKALLRRYKDENKEHYDSKHKQPLAHKLITPIANHGARVYTRAILNIFLVEVNESLHLTYKEKVEKDECSYHFLVAQNQDSNSKYYVSVSTKDWDASCECHLFEFQGILCRHILAIYQLKNMNAIPPKYILHRWTKEAADDISVPLTIETNQSALIRTFEFHCQTNLLLPYVQRSRESYTVLMDGLKRTYKELQKLDSCSNEAKPVEEKQTKVARTCLVDPLVARTKGRPKISREESRNGRFKGGLEIAMNKSKKLERAPRKCKSCGKYGFHDSRNCMNKTKLKQDDEDSDEDGDEDDESTESNEENDENYDKSE